MIDILYILMITSIPCSILGIFIVLKKQSMITDAISHSSLLGIVISYFIVRDLNSPLLIIGAAIMGVITVVLIELLSSTKLVSSSDSIGVVFPILFSIAIILISKYFKTTHLDTDIVLTGEVIFASLNTINIFGMEIPVAIIYSLITILVVLAFVLGFYKELKVSIFDPEYAKLIGIPVGFLFYALMTITSLTAVVSFNSVGSIMVISFFIAPAATSLLFTKRLRRSIILSITFGIVSCTIGYLLSINLNTSISGMCAVVNMIIYIIAVIYLKIKNKGRI